MPFACPVVVVMLYTELGWTVRLNAPPLGVMPDFMADRVEPIQMDPGGTLVVISDGIYEAAVHKTFHLTSYECIEYFPLVSNCTHNAEDRKWKDRYKCGDL